MVFVPATTNSKTAIGKVVCEKCRESHNAEYDISYFKKLKEIK